MIGKTVLHYNILEELPLSSYFDGTCPELVEGLSMTSARHAMKAKKLKVEELRSLVVEE